VTFRTQLKALLEEHGPMHCHEIGEEFGIAPRMARAKIGKLRATWPGEIRIADWRRDEAGGHLYPRACYGVGGEPDVPRPRPLSRRQYNQRHKRSVKLQVNSVWQLGALVADRRRAA
jgi:hypothetical protein